MNDNQARSAISAFVRRFRRADYIIATVLLAMLFAMLTSYKLTRNDMLYGDSAIFFQATENIARRGIAVSQVAGGVVNYFKYTHTPVEEIARNPLPLFGGPVNHPEPTLFRGHVYLILYPIALLVTLLPAKTVLLSLDVLTFTGLILVAYFALRRQGVSICGAALFCLLIAAHPAWWQSVLYGQFFPDRLFIFAGFIFMLLVSRSDGPKIKYAPNALWMLIAAIVCASVNERGALIAGMFLLAYTVLYWKKPGLQRSYRLILGVTLLFYGLAIVKFVLADQKLYGSFFPTSNTDLLTMFQASNLSQLVLFLLINGTLFCLAMFEWRAAAIALALMAPSILGGIGGAEKTGWSMHYPSFYFPALVWAASRGYVAVFRRARECWQPLIIYGGTGMLVLFLLMIEPNSYPLSINFANVNRTFLVSFRDALSTYVIATGPREVLESEVTGIAMAVPPGTVVSSIEPGMALLYQDRAIEFFPADIDRADYAVLNGAWIGGKPQYGGAYNALGAEEINKLNALVLDRMRLDGYDLDHPMIFPRHGLAVVRRGPRPHKARE